MKKSLVILVLGLLFSNLVFANELEQKQIYQDYKEKIFYAAEQKNEKKFQEICVQYKLQKEQKKIIGYNYVDQPGTNNDVNSNAILDFMCMGFGYAIAIFVGEYNDLFHETEIPHQKLCFEYMKFDIVGNELDQTLLRTHLGIVRYCDKL